MLWTRIREHRESKRDRAKARILKQTRNSVERKGLFRSRGRTSALRVGGRLFPGSSARADRPLFHSQIFFPRLNVFRLCRSSRAIDRKHLRQADACQRIANEGRFAVQAGIGFIGSQDAVENDVGIVDLFSRASLPRGAVKLRKAGRGPVGS